jgi:phosphohistidine phosphatase
MKKYLIRLDTGLFLIGAKIEKPLELFDITVTLVQVHPSTGSISVFMKTLYIVRHAKSSWDDSSLDDFSRPLNDRGKKDAPRMGKRLKEKEITVDLMISSPAKRALKTCKAIAEVLEYPESKIKLEKRLYHADEDSIFSILKSINEPNNVVMIFGHNPGLTEFANSLLGEFIMNIPTAGVVGGRLNIESWAEIKRGCGSLLFFDFPKNKV